MDYAIPMSIVQCLDGTPENQPNLKELKQDTLDLKEGKRSEMGLTDQTRRKLQYSPLPGDMEKQALECPSPDS